MTITVLDATTSAAISAAVAGANGTREAAVANAVGVAFGVDNVTLRVYSAADVLLCTIVREAVAVDVVSAQKSVTLGAFVSYTYATAGTPSYAIWANATTDILRSSAGVGSGDLTFLAAIAANVPVSAGSVRLTVSQSLDTDTGEFWLVAPETPVSVAQGGVLSVSTSGEYRMMAYSALPNGVEVLPAQITVGESATVGASTVIVGPDDFGYRLRPDDTNGLDLIGGSSNIIGGTSAKYYNGAITEWRTLGGVWRDERGFDQSVQSAYAVAITDTDTVKTVDVDVGWIVRHWQASPRDNYGIMLMTLSGGSLQIGTRQTGQPATLTIEYASGAPLTRETDVDALIATTTIVPTGALTTAITLTNDRSHKGLLFFDFPDSAYDGTITNATLTITTTAQFASSVGQPIYLGAMRVTDPRQPQGLPASATGKTLTWASGLYSGADPDILFGTQFAGITQGGATPAWMTSNFTRITTHGWQRAYTITSTYASHGISLPGTSPTAVLLTFPVGANLSNDQVYPFSCTYPFAKLSTNWVGRDSVFLHYRVCFGTDSIWSEAGKLIGVHGKLDLCGATPVATTDGNGGSPASDYGWSARGLLTTTAHGLETSAALRGLGVYAYHMDQVGSYGDRWASSNKPAGILVPGRWYDVDLEYVINTAGANDGIVRQWVDDHLVLERTDVQWRPTGVSARLVDPAVTGSQYDLNIAGAWIAPEYGGSGTVPPGEGGHIAVTDFLVSTSRIGRQP